MIRHWNQVWAFGYFCHNFGKSSGVLISPIQNGSQTLGNIGELSGVIVLPTKMGYKYCGINIGHVLIASAILVNQVGVIMLPTNNGSQI